MSLNYDFIFHSKENFTAVNAIIINIKTVYKSTGIGLHKMSRGTDNREITRNTNKTYN